MRGIWCSSRRTSTRDSWRGGGFSWETLEIRPGYLSARLSGPHKVITDFARYEPGGHRFQRVPPTEKRGRVHTSTVTTSILPEPEAADVQINDDDLIWRTSRSGGPGGQHANKTDSAVHLTHKPTGIDVRAETKSQHRNKELALSVLRARLAEREQSRLNKGRNEERRSQVGTGMRADKVRTIALQRGQVTDHVTGREATSKRYLRGEIDLLWP